MTGAIGRWARDGSLTSETAKVGSPRPPKPSRSPPADATSQRVIAAFGCPARLVAQDQAEAAAGTGGERQPPRRREVGVIAHELGHHRARRAAFQRLLHRPQSVARTRHLEDDQALQGKPHQREPRPVKRARLGSDEIGPDPDRLPALAQRQHGERRGKPRRRAAVARRGRPDLMQGAAGQAAAERPVERGTPKPSRASPPGREATGLTCRRAFRVSRDPAADGSGGWSARRQTWTHSTFHDVPVFDLRLFTVCSIELQLLCRCQGEGNCKES